jgi:putative spermidine/putrescine transport system substrate-binding protein
VPVGEVNPLNDEKIDRAFKKLEEIKSKLALWYQTTSQVESLLATGEVDCAELTSGRTFFLQSQGAPLQFVFDAAVMNLLIWVMAKNAPNKGNAERLLAFSSRPDRQAELAKVLFSGPTNKKTFALLTDDSLAHRLPTYAGNYARQVALDSDWWADNFDKLSGRWNKLTSG